MPTTETYRVAAMARSKLGREADRADHQLRLLVGHANLLDDLMVDLLCIAEDETADNGADKLKAPDELALSHTLRWTDLVSKDIDELQADSDSDSDSETESENDDSEDDEFDDEHALRRSPSRMPALIKSSAVRTAEQRPHLDHTIDRTAIPRRPRRVQTLEPIEEQASQDEILRDHESITAAYFRLEDKQAPPSRIHQLPSAIVEMVPSVLDPTVGESSSLPRIAAVG